MTGSEGKVLGIVIVLVFWGLKKLGVPIEKILGFKIGGTAHFIFRMILGLAMVALSSLFIIGFYLVMDKCMPLLVFNFLSVPLAMLCMTLQSFFGLWHPSKKNVVYSALLTLLFYLITLSCISSIFLYLFITPGLYILTSGFSLPCGPIDNFNPQYLGGSIFLGIINGGLGIYFAQACAHEFLNIVPNPPPIRGGKTYKEPPLGIRWNMAPLFLRKRRAGLWLFFKRIYKPGKSTAALVFAISMLVGLINVVVMFMLSLS